MGKGDHVWSFFSWLAGFTTFVVVTVIAQYVATGLYQAWWDSSGAAGQPIPAGTTMFLQWAVGGGVGLLAAKFVGDHV
jgi:hypothetical protein